MAQSNVTWETWQLLMEKRLLSAKAGGRLQERIGRLKFYRLSGSYQMEWAGTGDALYTAEYVRGWMYVYTQLGKLLKSGEGEGSLPSRDLQNLRSLQNRYPVHERFIKHPDQYAWYEVDDVTADGLTPMSSAMTVFEYNGPTPRILRKIELASFSMQLADLLH